LTDPGFHGFIIFSSSPKAAVLKKALECVNCNTSPSDFLDKADQMSSIEPATGPLRFGEDWVFF
jgi:hypothetical protein